MECPLLSMMDNFCAKRRQRQLGDLEELFSEGNPEMITAINPKPIQVFLSIFLSYFVFILSSVYRT